MSIVNQLLGRSIVKENGEVRVIDTGLTGPTNFAVLDSVMGQLSDGKWENSPMMRKFWKNASVKEQDGKVVIVIKDGWDSGFRGKDDAWIKSWFAGKIKEVAYDELDGRRWDRADTTPLDYLSRTDKPVTVRDAYQAYELLKGRNTKNRYAATPPAEAPASPPPSAAPAAPAPQPAVESSMNAKGIVDHLLNEEAESTTDLPELGYTPFSGPGFDGAGPATVAMEYEGNGIDALLVYDPEARRFEAYDEAGESLGHVDGIGHLGVVRLTKEFLASPSDRTLKFLIHRAATRYANVRNDRGEPARGDRVDTEAGREQASQYPDLN